MMPSLALAVSLYFTKTKPLKSYGKSFLFNLKCCFGYCDIDIFVFFILLVLPFKI